MNNNIPGHSDYVKQIEVIEAERYYDLQDDYNSFVKRSYVSNPKILSSGIKKKLGSDGCVDIYYVIIEYEQLRNT